MNRVYGKELDRWHLDIAVLHASRASFIALLIEAADFNINIPTNSTVFHAPIFYRFTEQFIKKLYDLYEEINKSLKPSFPRFMNENWDNAPDEQRKIKELSLNNTHTHVQVQLER